MGFLAMVCMYTSIQMLSLSKGQTLYFTGPVYVGLLAYIVFRERVSFIDILSIVLAFSGILLINNPFSESTPSEDSSIILGSLIAIFGGFCMACS